MSRVCVTSRRRVLQGGALLAGTALAGCVIAPGEVRDGAGRLFTLGVASGDPLPESVVLWTRLAPDSLNGGGMSNTQVDVTWEVATDDRFRQVVRRGVAVARPEHAHSVHVEVRGLRPESWYWYRFRVGAESVMGRTKTAPSEQGMPRQFRFAFASCQNYEQGYFTAYRHMAGEEIDLVVHLGDYIYEQGARPGRPRKHNALQDATSLTDYRNRYALYKLDPDLQAVHAAFPWAVVWDDHEVTNDYPGDHDVTGSDDNADFLRRRAAAYRAYYEHMPLRLSSRPSGTAMRLHRQLKFGDLLTLNLLDTRQYRSRRPCGSGWRELCDGANDKAATLLGAAQEHWLEEGLAASRTRWNVLAQQIPVMQRRRFKDGRIQYNMDKWDGYRAARQRLFETISRHHPSGLVVLSGDVHSTWVSDLKRDFDDPAAQTIGTEFVGTSISSRGDGWDTRPRFERMLAANPHILYYNGRRGYARCTVTPEQWHTDLRTVPYVSQPGAPVETKGSFVIDRGKPGVRQV